MEREARFLLMQSLHHGGLKCMVTCIDLVQLREPNKALERNHPARPYEDRLLPPANQPLMDWSDRDSHSATACQWVLNLLMCVWSAYEIQNCKCCRKPAIPASVVSTFISSAGKSKFAFFCLNPSFQASPVAEKAQHPVQLDERRWHKPNLDYQDQYVSGQRTCMSEWLVSSFCWWDFRIQKRLVVVL